MWKEARHYVNQSYATRALTEKEKKENGDFYQFVFTIYKIAD